MEGLRPREDRGEDTGTNVLPGSKDALGTTMDSGTNIDGGAEVEALGWDGGWWRTANVMILSPRVAAVGCALSLNYG